MSLCYECTTLCDQLYVIINTLVTNLSLLKIYLFHYTKKHMPMNNINIKSVRDDTLVSVRSFLRGYLKLTFSMHDHAVCKLASDWLHMPSLARKFAPFFHLQLTLGRGNSSRTIFNFLFFFCMYFRLLFLVLFYLS